MVISSQNSREVALEGGSYQTNRASVVLYSRRQKNYGELTERKSTSFTNTLSTSLTASNGTFDVAIALPELRLAGGERTPSVAFELKLGGRWGSRVGEGRTRDRHSGKSRQECRNLNHRGQKLPK